jgi:hypothetical protein
METSGNFLYLNIEREKSTALNWPMFWLGTPPKEGIAFGQPESGGQRKPAGGASSSVLILHCEGRAFSKMVAGEQTDGNHRRNLWPCSGFFAVAAIPAARSFAIRLISFTGTGLVSGKWTVPFRSS